jgi:hypothetical protein
MLKLWPVALLVVSVCLLGCESGTRIKSVDPPFGNVAGNDDVVIHGSGFKPGLVVQFGKHEVRSIIIDSEKMLRIKTPAGVEGKVDVVIIRDDGKTFFLKDGFTYMREAPTG